MIDWVTLKTGLKIGLVKGIYYSVQFILFLIGLMTVLGLPVRYP
jgi:hypothetical protein